jgi:NAD(P)-dependent dehydrogenase (short-subunit alcohol dehydrogenase family)
MNRLDGRIALISGTARGIRAETAQLMVEAGARVILGDILDERARKTAREIGGGDAAIFHHLDVTSEGDWIGAAVARWGRLDISINNAGMFLGKGIEEASLDEWHRLCAVARRPPSFPVDRHRGRTVDDVLPKNTARFPGHRVIAVALAPHTAASSARQGGSGRLAA